MPAVRINSGVEFRRVPTYLISATGTDSSYQLWDDPWENAKLPELSPLDPEEDGSFCEAMNNRLRDHSVQPLAYTTTSLSDFWPAKLFDHLFGYQEVCEIVNELVNDDISDGESPNGNPTDIIYHGKKDKNLPFRKVFAVLLLSGLQNLIHKFIAADVSDQELPLRADNRIFKQWKWKRTHVDMFRLYQWKLLVPFLGPSTDPGQLSQVEIRSEDICPWKRTSTSPRESCATVYQILVHPWQHGFQETLQEVCGMLSPNRRAKVGQGCHQHCVLTNCVSYYSIRTRQTCSHSRFLDLRARRRSIRRQRCCTALAAGLSTS